MIGVVADTRPAAANLAHYGQGPDIGARYRADLDIFLSDLDANWRVARRAAAQFDWVGVEKRGVQLPHAGWKLHLSIAADRAPVVFDLAHRLVACGASFKLPGSAEAIVRINGGEVGVSQIGKIVTIYPRDDAHLAAIAEALGGYPGPFGGPDIVGEYKLAGHNYLYLRYGAFGAGTARLTGRGDYQVDIRLPDGRVVSDDRNRSQPLAAPPLGGAWAREPQVGEIGSNGIAVLPLLLLHKTARGRVFLGIDRASARACIIKTARRGVAGDLGGFDAVGKLRNEYRTMLALAGRGICARPILFTEVDDTHYLVMEDLGGTPLKALPPDQKRRHLGKLTDIVRELHDAGFVHRDIKEENVVVRDGHVYLTDFELACAIGAESVPGGGTWGHIPPEGSTGAPDTDFYALAALIAGIELETSPANLPRELGRSVGLLGLHGKRNAAKLVAATALPRKGMRRLPSKSEIAGLAGPPRSTPLPSDAKLKKWARAVSLDAACATRAFHVERPVGAAWTNRHYAADHVCHGINLGAAGIILGQAVIAHCTGRHDAFDTEIEQAAIWLAAEDFRGAPGLFVGGAGVALSLHVAGLMLGRDDLVDNASRKLERAADDCIESDLFFGSAGVLLAASIMARIGGHPEPHRVGSRLAGQLAERVEQRAGVFCWPFVEPFERRTEPFFGAAHGAAGIAAALGEWARVSGQAAFDALARRSLTSIGDYMRETGNGSPRFERRMGDPAFALASEWCHGTAGFAWALLRTAGARRGTLAGPLAWAVERLGPTMSASNPTYCHGLAGRLELMMMLRTRPEYRDWADATARTTAAALRLGVQRRGGHRVWGAEDPRVITPDLWVGGLGPAASLALFAAGVPFPLLSAEVLGPVAMRSA